MRRISIFLCFCTFLMVQDSFAQTKTFKIGAVGFYNFENLFDTLDTPDVRDTEFSPKGDKNWTSSLYYDKLNSLADVVSKLAMDKTPDGISILGVSEVENRSVLEDFVNNKKIKSRNYQICHVDSPDKRGIDVALLYNPKYFEVTEQKAIPLMLYNKSGERVFTRDILMVSGLFDGEPMHFLVNHWPSRRGGEKATAPWRNQAAAVCKKVVDSLALTDPLAKVVVMGDMNDDPTNASCKKILRGKAKKKQVAKGDMFNPMCEFYKKGYGTTAWRDAWSLFDQIVVSRGFIESKEGYRYYQTEVFREKFMIQKTGKFKGYPLRTFVGNNYMGGYSDHFPVYFYMVKESN